MFDSHRQRIQCSVRAPMGPESVRKPEEIHLVDCIQYLDHRSLYDLVFERCDAQRSLPPVRLGNEGPSRWFRSVRSSMQSAVQRSQVLRKSLSVLLEIHPVYPGCRFRRQCQVGRPQSLHCDMVKQRRELRRPVPSRCFSHAAQLM